MRRVEGWWIPDEHACDKRDPVLSQWRESQLQIKAALPFIAGRGTVIQAGGRVGLWPRMLLAAGFEKIVTFEPELANYECAVRNLEDFKARCSVTHAALGRRRRAAMLAYSSMSDGEHFIAHGARALGPGVQSVQMVCIDSLELQVDAIFLDVEGYELEVLEGARQTLTKWNPTIVVEENELCARYGRGRGQVRHMLRQLGYELVHEFTTLPPAVQNDGQFHGSDLIFAYRHGPAPIAA